MNSLPTSLTAIEREDLSRYELIIERGLRSFQEAGQALSEINERRLYRERYNSFEEYCSKHWHFERAHAYRLIEAARVIANLSLSPAGDSLPVSEWQVRPLTQLEPAEQVEAWAAAKSIAGDKPVASHVQRAVDAVKQGGGKAPRQGETVLVLDERSPDYGKVGQVVEANGIVVQVAVEDRVHPLLVNEVRSHGASMEVSDRPTNIVAQTPIKPAPKPNPVTLLTAELEICEARIKILELEIDIAIALIKKFSCDRNYPELADWIKKVDTLLRG